MTLSISAGRTIGRWSGTLAGLVLFNLPVAGIAETLVTERIDGSSIEILIERPDRDPDLPIVLFIDGSGCQGARRQGFQDFSRLPDAFADRAARVFVDKPGIDANWKPGECTQTFKDYYTIDQRVLDHLRAIQHLRRHASWWNGDIYLVGWSDGAMIGVSVAAFTPEVSRAVFMALGGGIPMSR